MIDKMNNEQKQKSRTLPDMVWGSSSYEFAISYRLLRFSTPADSILGEGFCKSASFSPSLRNTMVSTNRGI
jgi:hypothetical protein